MSLVVGIPRETKSGEHRVALTPDGVRELARAGVVVRVERGAGAGASVRDEEYAAAGAVLVGSAADAWAADLVCKVKEPQPDELQFLRPDLVLFAYLHLAAYPDMAKALVAAGTTAIAYETVQLPGGGLPLLAPMSHIAGRLAAQVSARFLERASGGRGVLLGGAPGVQPARVVVVGAGSAGTAAASVAAGMDADVVLLDLDVDRLASMDAVRHRRVTTIASNAGALERAIADADAVVGAVLVPGGRAPTVVSEEMVRSMRPGSVVVDISIDQGGCVAGIRETTHDAPVYDRHGVLHYAVGNIPGAVPHTSTYALTNVTLPYLVALASDGVAGACSAHPVLLSGVNTAAGAVTHAAAADALGVDWADPGFALAS